MPDTIISNLDYSDLSNAMTDYSVAAQKTDGARDSKETEYINDKFEKQLGYYKTIPELRTAIDARATWTVGKGFQSGQYALSLLGKITGFGKDTFNTILENMIRTMWISGDSYAEIIRDKKGNMINLKPLDPSTMKIIANRSGVIKRYEQINGKKVMKFETTEIFHLSRNRIADEIHGVSVIDSVENIILMRNEAMSDWKRVLHRNVEPMMIFHLDTDDTSEIATFKSKMDAAKGAGENMYIPKDAVVPEQVSTAGNSTLNPLPWIDNLNSYFFQACGVPLIIVGGAQEITEASAKIAYLAFQQSVEEDQLYIEEAVATQLGLIIELEFPASLENEMLSDKMKDSTSGAAKPSDVTAGAGQ